jgi:hypothetical protein
MNFALPYLNLQMAWLWIVFGFVTGLVLGLFFHREGWLGGYGSMQRRLYRLGHISFFGLGVVNLCFFVTVERLGAYSPLLPTASWTFIVGAISMPLCCLIMAHFPRLHLIFSVPVVALLLGAVLTLSMVSKARPADEPFQPITNSGGQPVVAHQPTRINGLPSQ